MEHLGEFIIYLVLDLAIYFFSFRLIGADVNRVALVALCVLMALTALLLPGPVGYGISIGLFMAFSLWFSSARGSEVVVILIVSMAIRFYSHRHLQEKRLQR